MTYIDKLPVTFTGDGASSLPIYKSDPILNAGSLLLLEPAISWPAGVPASGTKLPNLAASRAAALGLVNAETVDWVMDAEANDGVHSILERTGKGGIHNILSKNAPLTAGQNKGAAAIFPDSVIQYIAANPTHEFNWSLWGRLTRTGPAQYVHVASVAMGASTSVGIGPAPYVGFATADTAGNKRITRSKIVPATPVAADMLDGRRRQAFSFGRRAQANTNLTGMPSYALYRVYLEDATIAGAAGNSFGSIDADLFNAAFASGGRYYNDTFTDPATLP